MSEHAPGFGDLYRHTQTQAYVIVLAVKQVADECFIRLGRLGYGTPLEINVDEFYTKFEWVEVNVLNERAQGDEVGDNPL
jgi:hypothetical protein